MTFAVHDDVWAVVIDPGMQFTATPVITEAAFTATLALPDFVLSCTEVATMDAVPGPLGVNTPEPLTVPAVDGFRDQITEGLKVPSPVTFAVQADVCVFKIVLGEHETVTADTLEADPTETAAIPDLLVSSIEVAVIVALPVAAAVNTPPVEIVPFVAVQVTA